MKSTNLSPEGLTFSEYADRLLLPLGRITVFLAALCYTAAMPFYLALYPEEFQFHIVWVELVFVISPLWLTTLSFWLKNCWIFRWRKLLAVISFINIGLAHTWFNYHLTQFGTTYPGDILGIVILFGCLFFGLKLPTLIAICGTLLLGAFVGQSLSGMPQNLMTLNLTLLAGMVVGCLVFNHLSVQMLKKLYEDQCLLETYSRLDPLTQLANRRHIETHYEKVARHAYRENENLFLALVDIDNFKQLNDNQGHAAGDQALTYIAELLQNVGQRPFDLVARWGGDEFIVFLHDCDLRTGEKICEHLRRTVWEQNIRIAGPSPYDSGVTPVTYNDRPNRITLTIGGIYGTFGELALMEVVEMADVLLYQLKSKGRNRVEVAEWEPSPSESATTAQ